MEPEPPHQPEIPPRPPAPSNPTLLLFRPDDLVALSVWFNGFTLVHPTEPGQPSAFVAGDHAFLDLTFPPQVIQELRLSGSFQVPANGFVAYGTAGPSTLRTGVAAGTVVPATVAGVLAAADGAPVLTATAKDTHVELPLGIVMAPVPVDGNDVVAAHHPSAPRRNGDTTAVWQTDLRTPSGLAMKPLSAVDRSGWGNGPADPDTTEGPLNAGQTVQLVGATTGVADADLPRLSRLQLSALGGSLTARGAWSQLTWQQDTALGRDRRVQVTQRGVLLPFGHTALLVEVAERAVEPTDGGGNVVVRSTATLYIDPVRVLPPGDPQLAHQFPFDRVDILVTTVEGLDADDPDSGSDQPHLVPSRGGRPVQFPVRLYGSQGTVDTATELIFLGTKQDPAPSSATAKLDVPAPISPAGLTVDVAMPAARVDLVRSATPQPADVHLVHGLTLATVIDAATTVGALDSYRPTITSLTVDLPAVRALLPPGASTLVRTALSEDLKANGTAALTVLDGLVPIDAQGNALADKLGVDFSGDAARAGGLVTPSFVADTVHRAIGPVAKDVLDAVAGLPVVPDLESLFKDATLLGLKLSDVLSKTLDGLPLPQIHEAVRAAEEIAAGTPPTATMSWTRLPLKSAGAFLVDSAAAPVTLDLTVTAGPDEQSVDCTLHNLRLALPDAATDLLTLKFDTLRFTTSKGHPPALTATGVKAVFTGALDLVQTLQEKIDLGDAGRIVKVTEDAITASYALSLPEASCGLFDLRNIDFRSAVVVPLTGKPASVAISFASRDKPFTLAVMAFGGGGYLDLLVDTTGLQHFEGSLDFGAQLAVNFVVAAGEVHAFGGVRFRIAAVPDLRHPGQQVEAIDVTAFLRFGGSLQVLGVVTVSLEVSIELAYVDPGTDATAEPKLTGRAMLVIEVDITIWSDSVELDTGTWEIVGGSDDHPLRALDAGDDAHAAWRTYREAFAV